MSDVQDTIQVRELKTEKTLPETAAWTTTNVVTTRALNANVNNTLVTSDVLCTLIEDLKTKGILE